MAKGAFSPRFIDLTGKKFGRLVVMSYEGLSDAKRPRSLWLCKCDCGEQVLRTTQLLNAPNSHSCGCQTREINIERNTKHGRHKSLEYRTWANMLQRCTNPKASMYALWGGNGICVCDRWRVFECFYEDMGPRPTANHQIDRIDSIGNYEPGNCRWATPKEQSNNTSRNVIIEWNGSRKSVSEWSLELGIKRPTLDARLKRGWSIEKAFTTKANTKYHTKSSKNKSGG